MSSQASRPAPVPTQILGVSYQRDLHGQESLVYARQTPHAEMPPPEPVEVRIGLGKLARDLQAIHREVENLTLRAMHGQSHSGEELSRASCELARDLLPETGFADLVSPGAHPQLDIWNDAAAEIPWEAMQERYFVCEGEGRHQAGEASDRNYCSICGQSMRSEGGKVALRYHLTHLVRGGSRSAVSGRRFLLVEDPRSDLLTDDRDPEGICRDHLAAIRERLAGQGFEVESCRGPNATVGRFINYLTDPSTIGLYYFGHGGLPQGAPEGYLELADGKVSASEIEKAAPAARFVFLNACWGGRGGDWTLEGRNRSVAAAFARGGHKVVVAPMWPVVNAHAAEMAKLFFGHVSPTDPAGEAMQRARKSSFRRFEQGEPHLGWMAYRYFGDPESPLPAPEKPGVEVRPGVFNRRGRLNREIFSFEIEPILLRAGKRRMLEGRALLEVGDVVAGMVRAGDLTRGLIRRRGADPDRIYEAIVGKAQESHERRPKDDASGAGDLPPDPLGLKKLFSEWLVRERRQLSPELQEALDVSARARMQRSESGEILISERDLLEVLLDSDGWSAFAELGLPAAESLQSLLADEDERMPVDDDGSLRLDFLRPEARKVIQTAHVLAQQRGVFPITNRLLLAAFLADPEGAAAKRLAGFGLPVGQLHALIVALSRQKPPKTFGLSPEACNRSVWPTIEAARQGTRAAGPISEDELLLAFCHQASREFKGSLRSLVGLDLDLVAEGVWETPGSGGSPRRGRAVRSLNAKDFEPGVWELLLAAADLARGQGSPEIRTPHLFAVFLDAPDSPADDEIRRQDLNTKAIKEAVLSVVRPRDLPDVPVAGAHTAQVLERSRRTARASGRREITAEDLWEAFFADGGGVVGKILRHAGFKPPAKLSTREVWDENE